MSSGYFVGVVVVSHRELSLTVLDVLVLTVPQFRAHMRAVQRVAHVPVTALVSPAVTSAVSCHLWLPSSRRYARTKHPCDLQSRRGRGGGNTPHLPSDCDTAPAPDSPASGKLWSSSSTVNYFAHLFQLKVFPPSDRKSNINLPAVANVPCCIFVFAILGRKLIVFESSELTARALW